MKEMRLRKILCLLSSLIFITFIVRFFCLSKSPIVSTPATASVIEVLYVYSSSGDTKNIVNYDESEILDYLGSSYQKQAYTKSYTFQSSQYILIITIQDGNKVKQLHLGNNDSYISEGVDHPIQKLCNEDQILSDLLNILNITSEKN